MESDPHSLPYWQRVWIGDAQEVVSLGRVEST